MRDKTKIYLTAPDNLMESDWFTALEENIRLAISRTLDNTCELRVRNRDDFSLKDIEACNFFIPVLTSDKEVDDNFQKELEEIASFLTTKFKESDIPDHLYKILLAPSSQVYQPELFLPVCGQNFFEIQKRKNEAVPHTFENKEKSITAWKLILDLAYDIKTNLSSNDQEKGIKKSAYITLCSSDAWSARDEIKRELHQLGYQVYPKIDVIYNADTMEANITNMLQMSDCLVQVIGARYGKVSKGDRLSSIEKESNVIDSYLNSHKQLKRFIWVPDTTERRDPKIEMMLNKIRNTKQTSNAEIIKAPIDEFKDILIPYLTERESNSEKLDDLPSLYLIHEANADLSGFLEAINPEQINVCALDYNNEKSLFKSHLDFMAKTDHVLIMFTNNDALWLKSKLSDLVKAPGMGRKNPFKSYAIAWSDKLPDISSVSHWLPALKTINLADQEQVSEYMNGIIE